MIVDSEDSQAVALGRLAGVRVRAAGPSGHRVGGGLHPGTAAAQGQGGWGLATAREQERSGRPTRRTYLFRGRIRCAYCHRKMEGSPRAHGMYYRCPARTLAPNSPALAEHPPSVYLREQRSGTR